MSGLSLRVMNMKFMQKSSLNSNKLSDLEISREQAAKASDSSEWTSKSNANIVKSIKSLRQNTKVTSIGYASIQNFGSGDCTEALVRGRRSFVPKEQQQSSSSTNSQQEDKVKLDLNNLRESLDDEKKEANSKKRKQVDQGADKQGSKRKTQQKTYSKGTS